MPPPTRSPSQQPWHKYITIDLLVSAAQHTILHPFVAWMLPLSLRAQATPYSHPAFQISVAYAALLTLLSVLSSINRRIAYGASRDVDLSEEVIVITGGASGLGLLIAEVYGMRGCNVAVLDVKEVESAEAKGIKYYKCDVSDATQVDKAVIRIEHDVRESKTPLPPTHSHSP